MYIYIYIYMGVYMCIYIYIYIYIYTYARQEAGENCQHAELAISHTFQRAARGLVQILKSVFYSYLITYLELRADFWEFLRTPHLFTKATRTNSQEWIDPQESHSQKWWDPILKCGKTFENLILKSDEITFSKETFLPAQARSTHPHILKSQLHSHCTCRL